MASVQEALKRVVKSQPKWTRGVTALMLAAFRGCTGSMRCSMCSVQTFDT